MYSCILERIKLNEVWNWLNVNSKTITMRIYKFDDYLNNEDGILKSILYFDILYNPWSQSNDHIKEMFYIFLRSRIWETFVINLLFFHRITMHTMS